ncbi:glycosyltransferase family 9 protein [Candidatus Endomicrobiellum trichonymphae]|uniref:glycosyltransferase family 9 protein n=1 Tax=Endomicrobium trichonymphae TaxID=1408204 RepID=UPI002F9104AA
MFSACSLGNKKKISGCEISWIVDDRCVEILNGSPFLENIFIWGKRQISFKYYKNLRQRLRGQKFDLSIDLHGLAKSAMLVELAGAKFKIASSSINGMKEFSCEFLTDFNSLRLLSIPVGNLNSVRKWFEENNLNVLRTIAVSVDASRKRQDKCLERNKWIEVIDMIYCRT